MSIKYDKYMPLYTYLSPASIPQIVAHIQDYLVKHPILSVETIAEIIVQSLQEHPELINGTAIPISADSEQSIKAYIDALPSVDTYTKAEINTLLTGKQDTLTFDQAPTPGSSNPVTSSGIIAAMSAMNEALETLINAKADSASTYTKTQVDTLLEDKADAADVYSKNTMDAKLLDVNTALINQSQQILNLQNGVAYVENGNIATIKTYSAGEFILWKGSLYTVNSGGIPVTTAIAEHVTAVTGGGLNALNSNLAKVNTLSQGGQPTNVDFNKLPFGICHIATNTATNAPNATFYGIVETIVGITEPVNWRYIIQKAYKFDSINIIEIYVRGSNDNGITWKEWVQLQIGI